MRGRAAGIPWFWLVVLLAAGALALVTWWVSAGGINRGEALKTGGLAAGSVVALYALWLNDRRRRTEEQRREIERQRQDLESQRAEHDRERVADELFARAVELLGNEADQVRVGGLHALAGLARSRPAYTQTVLDVLCSYLRRPFDHYRYAETRGDKARTWADAERQAADREQQVRRTAQQLIADLLPPASDPDAPRYDLDLHGATLEYFDISNRTVGQIRARQTNLYEATAFWGCQVRGLTWFTASRNWGRLRMHDTVFHDRSWFSKFESAGLVTFKNTSFRGDTKFANAIFRGPVSFQDSVFASDRDFANVKVALGHPHQLPDGYTVDTTIGREFGLVRASAEGYVAGQ